MRNESTGRFARSKCTVDTAFASNYFTGSK